MLLWLHHLIVWKKFSLFFISIEYILYSDWIYFLYICCCCHMGGKSTPVSSDIWHRQWNEGLGWCCNNMRVWRKWTDIQWVWTCSPIECLHWCSWRGGMVAKRYIWFIMWVWRQVIEVRRCAPRFRANESEIKQSDQSTWYFSSKNLFFKLDPRWVPTITTCVSIY